ncbi:MAG: hypothetical protein OEU32_10060 [Acidimicrobiia bacterium]|nr:hypothetical protein [Acidimicrobiia bacterium]
MPIAEGEDWGEPAPVPAGAVAVASDAAARDELEASRRRSEPLPELVLTGGDLHRTLGGSRSEARLRAEGATRVRCDLGVALCDGVVGLFIAHLVIGGHFLSGRTTAVCNASFVGRANLAPRAHPGDGLFDVIEADLPLRQRMLAWGRLPSGSHIPHPGITSRRTSHRQFGFSGRGRPVRLDGAAIGLVRSLSVRVEPAAVSVYV